MASREQREKYTVSFTHRFSKIRIGCVYTFLKKQTIWQPPSFWAGQLPPLLHSCAHPHTLIHVTSAFRRHVHLKPLGAPQLGVLDDRAPQPQHC